MTLVERLRAHAEDHRDSHELLELAAQEIERLEGLLEGRETLAGEHMDAN